MLLIKSTVTITSSNKMNILSKNITELRKGDFDKVTTKTLQLNKMQVNEELMSLLNQQMKLQILLTFVIRLPLTLSLSIIN